MEYVNEAAIWEGDSPIEKMYQGLLEENMELKKMLMDQVEKNHELYQELNDLLSSLKHHPSVNLQKLKSLTDNLTGGE